MLKCGVAANKIQSQCDDSEMSFYTTKPCLLSLATISNWSYQTKLNSVAAKCC